MEWSISWSKEALLFLDKNNVMESTIVEILKKAKEKLEGKDVNVNVKKLDGAWKPFLRIRMGDIRIIAEYNFPKRQIYVHRIDYRGNVYA